MEVHPVVLHIRYKQANIPSIILYCEEYTRQRDDTCSFEHHSSILPAAPESEVYGWRHTLQVSAVVADLPGLQRVALVPRFLASHAAAGSSLCRSRLQLGLCPYPKINR